MRVLPAALCCASLLLLASHAQRASMQSTSTPAMTPSATATLSVNPSPATTPTEQPSPSDTPTSPAPPPPPGDTPTPTAQEAPTDTPTPSPTVKPRPSGAELLARMRSAINHARSVHVDFVDIAYRADRTTVTTTSFGDLSWAHNLLHQATTVVRKSGTPGSKPFIDQQYELKIVGQTAAIRPGHLSWACQKLVHASVLSTLLAMQTAIVQPEDMGETRLDGKTVRHVRARGSVLATAGAKRPTIDYYLSPSSALPVEVKSVVPASAGLKPETVTETYSRWGEKLTVTLPAKCARF